MNIDTPSCAAAFVDGFVSPPVARVGRVGAIGLIRSVRECSLNL